MSRMMMALFLLCARVAGCTDPTIPHGLPPWLSVPAAGYQRSTQITMHASYSHQLRRTGTIAVTVGKDSAADCRVKCRTSIPPLHLQSACALLSKLQEPVHSSGVKSNPRQAVRTASPALLVA